MIVVDHVLLFHHGEHRGEWRMIQHVSQPLEMVNNADQYWVDQLLIMKGIVTNKHH